MQGWTPCTGDRVSCLFILNCWYRAESTHGFSHGSWGLAVTEQRVGLGPPVEEVSTPSCPTSSVRPQEKLRADQQPCTDFLVEFSCSTWVCLALICRCKENPRFPGSWFQTGAVHCVESGESHQVGLPVRPDVGRACEVPRRLQRSAASHRDAALRSALALRNNPTSA